MITHGAYFNQNRKTGVIKGFIRDLKEGSVRLYKVNEYTDD